jgi:hypothetical protein
MRGKTIADELVGNILVVVHTHLPPDPTEWTVHCGEIAARRAALRGVVVMANGSGPSASQRHELREAWGGDTPPPIAVMSHSLVARGVLTALNWFMANRLKPFSENDFAGAFGYLKLDGASGQEVLATMRRLADQLGVALRDGAGKQVGPPR